MNFLLSPAKHNSTVFKATTLSSSLLSIVSAQDMPFCHPQQVKYMHHVLISKYFTGYCSALITLQKALRYTQKPRRLLCVRMHPIREFVFFLNMEHLVWFMMIDTSTAAFNPIFLFTVNRLKNAPQHISDNCSSVVYVCKIVNVTVVKKKSACND